MAGGAAGLAGFTSTPTWFLQAMAQRAGRPVQMPSYASGRVAGGGPVAQTGVGRGFSSGGSGPVQLPSYANRVVAGGGPVQQTAVGQGQAAGSFGGPAQGRQQQQQQQAPQARSPLSAMLGASYTDEFSTPQRRQLGAWSAWAPGSM